MKSMKSLALAVSLGLGAFGSAEAVLIDNFDVTSQSVAADGSDTAAAPEAIGGFRTIEITKAGPLGATASVLVPPGIYSHSADALTSATSVITWDANGAGLGGVDLTGGLLNPEFVLDVLFIDIGGINLSISVTDTDGDSDTQAVPVPGGFTAPGTLTLAFSAFDPAVDFTSINSVSLTIAGDTASDLILDLLQTQGDTPPPPPSVPEPGILLLLGSGLIGLFGVRGRKASA